MSLFFLLSITLKYMGFFFFSLCKASLFSLLHITMDGLCKILYFSIWSSNLFFSDLVLIKDQLILISYEKMVLKEEELKKKKHQTWVICYKFRKRCTLILEF
jgi:hypothetical protein